MSEHTLPTATEEQKRGLCPACGAALIIGNIALGWGARPAFQYKAHGGPTIDVPVEAGLCPACGFVSFWSVPSAALRSVLRLHADTSRRPMPS